MVNLNLTTKVWPEKFELRNKNILITGIGLIGSIISKNIVYAGAKVIVSDIDKNKGKILMEEFDDVNQEISFIPADISDENSVKNLLQKIKEKYDVIDGFVNTAYPKTKDWGDKEQLLNYKSWKENLNLHLGGYYLTSINVAEIMKDQGFGSIINMGSIYGVSAPDFKIYEGTEMTTPIAYPSIKAGINLLTKYIASYYGSYNIRANVIAPGGLFDNQPKNFVSKYINKVPLKRMANSDDIVGPVIFLLSDASAYITGQVLLVDGGWTI